MIQMCRKSGAKVVLFGMQIPPNYGQQYAKQFRDLYPTLATQENIVLLPFFLNGIAGKSSLFQEDRLHPNVEAQAILFKNVWGAIAPYKKMLIN
jgi:acyl-CoA thioesterase-1